MERNENMSLTFVGVIVAMVGGLFAATDKSVPQADIETTIQVLSILGGSLLALYRRYTRGDVTTLGVRKD